MGVEIPPASKVYRLFSDGRFRDVYMFEEYPDREFVVLFLNALEETKAENLERVIERVLEKMGGFSIDGWKLRTPVKV